jgi:hypothetical protein
MVQATRNSNPGMGKKNLFSTTRRVGDSSIGIATGYGLDGPVLESRWGGGRFFAHFQTSPGAHPASCTIRTESFPRVMRPGRGADHPPPSSTDVTNEWSYTSTQPTGPSEPVIWRNLLYYKSRKYTRSTQSPIQLFLNNWGFALTIQPIYRRG